MSQKTSTLLTHMTVMLPVFHSYQYSKDSGQL